VDETLEQYILGIVRATRNHPDIAVGASPRGSLALYKTAQAFAALHGRDYVVPEDVREMAPLTLPHRISIKPESQLRGRDARTIVGDIVQHTTLDLGDKQ
jgi:MoxR-like ATPase